MTYDSRPVLVCTLGGKAQVATFTIDALLKQKVEIGKVVIIHHAPPEHEHRLREAINLLKRQVQSYYQNQFILEDIPIRDKKGPITDLHDAPSVTAAWETMDQTISALQARHTTLHFCFTGGRRMLAMQAMSVLSLHATPNDTLWHLYTPTPLREAAAENAVLHATDRPDLPDPYLIQVPLVPWAHFFKGLRELLQLNPMKAIQLGGRVLDEQEVQRCQVVWSHLPPALQESLYQIAKGKSPQDAAVSLGITLSALRGYFTDIRQECRTAWGMDSKESISYDWLRQKFAPVIDRLPRKSQKNNEKSG